MICLHNTSLLSGYNTREHDIGRFAVLLDKGHIVDVFTQRRFEEKSFDSSVRFIDLKGAYLTPGFIDTHIHGVGGYGVEDNTVESILKMSDILTQYGVTGFFPTIYPQSVDVMLDCIKACVEAIGQEKGARIMGIHLEGPFISPQRPGVQLVEYMRQPDINLMKRFVEAGKGHIRSMTVAPELKGMRQLALFCLQENIVLQAGHTDATYEHMLEGMQAGILHSTHFFNAMSSLHHRNPNAVGAILIHSEMSCEVIADGVHVHPDLFTLLMRDKPVRKITLITDALKPTEQKSGDLYANGEKVYLKDGIFHREKDHVIAGSSLTMIRGVQNLVDWGISLYDAVKMATSSPAHTHRLDNFGMILPGYKADFTAFTTDFHVVLTLVNGNIVYDQLDLLSLNP